MVEIYETYDPMEANLIKAKLNDEEIPFRVSGDFNIAMSMETFNTPIGRIALKRPIVFSVPESLAEIALVAINTDKSSSMDEDLDY